MNTTTDATLFEKIAKAGMIGHTIINGLPGMTSREISEITGKRHDHVLRDIRKMLTELELIDVPKSGEIPRAPEVNANLSQCQWVDTQAQDSYGRSQPLTVLDKELTFTLLSRYSFKLSNLIVKRWLELEGSGFTRVPVKEAIIHLVERENDVKRAFHRQMKRATRPLTDEQKEAQKWQRAARKYANESLGRHWEK